MCNPVHFFKCATRVLEVNLLYIGDWPFTMPKEHKKRGKREESKRKREVEDENSVSTVKRRTDYTHIEHEIKLDIEPSRYAEDVDEWRRPGEKPFYGMLDDEEQEYFKRADTMLELNQFANLEERELFLANVYTEANGKELKIVNSQSCSRLMERLILLSTSSQLKALFQKFGGQ